MSVAFHLVKEQLLIQTGDEVERDIKVEDIQIPLETIDDRCVALHHGELTPTIICADSLKEKLEVSFALYQAILCKETGVAGHFPLKPSPVIEKVEEADEEVPPADVVVKIHPSPKRGKVAFVTKDGVRIEDLIKKERVEETKQSGPSIYEKLGGFFSAAVEKMRPQKKYEGSSRKY